MSIKYWFGVIRMILEEGEREYLKKVARNRGGMHYEKTGVKRWTKSS